MAGVPESLCRVVSQLRDHHGMSQVEIARAADISMSALSRVRRGERRFNLKMARNVADAFGLSKVDRGRLLQDVDSFHNVKMTPFEKEALSEAFVADAEQQ